jgi:hypothetical protein
MFGIEWMNILKSWNGQGEIGLEGLGVLLPRPFNGPLLSEHF